MDPALMEVTDGLNNKKRKLESKSHTGPSSAKHICIRGAGAPAVESNADEFSDEDLFSVESLSIFSQSQRTQSQQPKCEYDISSEPFENKKAKVVSINSNPPVAIVQVLDEKGEDVDEFHEVQICDGWIVREGDFIYAPPEFSDIPIFHSDTLTSCTSIATAATCPRRSVLSERFRDGEMGIGSSRMIMGNLLHELFQSALHESMKKRKITSEYLKKEMVKLALSKSYDIIQCGISIQKFLEGCTEYYVIISKLINDLTVDGTTIDLAYTSESNLNRTNHISSSIVIDQVKDIEENLWEPRLGIKGKIDITAKFRIKRKDNNTNKELVIPIELKSGKGNSLILDHKIQTQLYGMVQSFRHETKTSFKDTTSILIYIKTGKMFSVPIKSNEINQILAKRNDMVGHIRHPLIKEDHDYSIRPLPPLLEDGYACEKCFKRSLCAFWAQAEHVEPTERKIKELFQNDTEHITHDLNEYIQKWTKLGLLEELEEAKQSRGKELWNSDSTKTIRNVTVDKKQNRNGAKFSVICQLPRDTEWPFGSKTFGDKERISISTRTKVAIAFGYCVRIIKPSTALGPFKVELELDRQLDPKEGPFRIDTAYNAGGGNFSARLWLGNVWLSADRRYNDLRKILKGERVHIIPMKNGKPDILKILSGPDVTENEARAVLYGVIDNKNMNRDQKCSIRDAIGYQFRLIQGFPGSGKSNCIVSLIEILIKCKKRVILTAHTHSAVDNVLERIIEKFSDNERKKIVRIGDPNKFSLKVKPYAERNLFTHATDEKQLIKQYMSKLLIAGTCMGLARHDIFNHVQADWTIVDEAGQVAEPIVLGPLFFSKRFVLVGDQQQLPPLLRSRKARQLGGAVSLMERLAKEYPDKVNKLKRQYRFHQEINDISSHLAYEGLMEADNSVMDVKLSASEIGLGKPNQSRVPKENWLFRAVDPESIVTWIDTSEVGNLEQKAESGYTNPTEIKLIKLVTKSLNEYTRLKLDNVGIIAPYRAQIKALTKALPDDIDINTVDKFQGKESFVIIISFVRSSSDTNGEIRSDLLESLQRMNVAITRAKYKMILVGCCSTLDKLTHMHSIISHCRKHNYVVKVPKNFLSSLL